MTAPSLGSAWRAQVGAEIKNRLRSPASLIAFLVILLGSYWAIPPANGRASSVSWRLADGRMQAPELSSSYLGIAVSVLMIIFFLMAAFYLVAGSVKRDRERGIGLLLAASPLSKTSYLGAKLVAHVTFLALLSLLAVPVGVFHFLRSGVGAFEWLPFFTPALLVVLPAAAFISAMALLFDVTPGLRSKGGLVLWFLVGMPLLSAFPITHSRDAMDGPVQRLPAFDPLGLVMNQYVIQSSLPPGAGGVSTGYVIHKEAPERVSWRAAAMPPAVVASRVLQLLWAVLPFFAAVWVFDRFDPARRSGRARKPGKSSTRSVVEAASPLGAASLASLAPVQVRPNLGPAIWAETRLLWESAHPVKWLLPPAALTAAFLPAAAVPFASSVFLLLLVPVISEVGCREELAGAGPLVFSQPAVPSSVVLWKFAAVAFFLLTVSLPLTLRGVFTGSLQALTVPLGLLFVAAFAVAAASLSRGGKLFSGVFLLLWYLGLNGLAGADFSGLLAPEVTWGPRLGFTLAGAAWLAAAVAWEQRRCRSTT